MRPVIQLTLYFVNLIDYWLLWSFPREVLFKFSIIRLFICGVKWIFHLVTGKCEIHRLIDNRLRRKHSHKPPTISPYRACRSLEGIMITSKSIGPTMRVKIINAGKPSSQIKDPINQLCKLLIKVKILSRAPRFRKCLCDLVGSIAIKHRLIEYVKESRAQPFNGNDKSHLALLQKLWIAFKSNKVPMPPIPDERWKELGFQGTDPTSDFRSLGLFGLQQLVYFAEYDVNCHRQLYQEAQYGPYWYSFAIVGLNATNTICTYLKNGQLDALLFSSLCAFNNEEKFKVALDVINKSYVALLTIFHKEWMCRKPENLLAFNAIFAVAMKKIEESLKKIESV